MSIQFAFAQPKPSSEAIERELIRRTVTDFAVAWNNHDVSRLATMFSSVSNVLGPPGIERSPSDEELLRRDHTTFLQSTRLNLLPPRITFVRTDLVTVVGTFELDIGSGHPLHGEYVFVMVKVGSIKWEIVSSCSVGPLRDVIKRP